MMDERCCLTSHSAMYIKCHTEAYPFSIEIASFKLVFTLFHDDGCWFWLFDFFMILSRVISLSDWLVILISWWGIDELVVLWSLGVFLDGLSLEHSRYYGITVLAIHRLCILGYISYTLRLLGSLLVQLSEWRHSMSSFKVQIIWLITGLCITFFFMIDLSTFRAEAFSVIIQGTNHVID